MNAPEVPWSEFRRTFRQIATCATFYVLSYGILSFFGGYRLLESGHFRPITWMSMEDVFIWQPRFGMCYAFDTIGGEHTQRRDPIGMLYYPLIRFDQSYVHKSRPFVTVSPDGTFNWRPWPDIALMHPIARRAIRLSDAIDARYQPSLDAAKARNDKAEHLRIWKAKWDKIEQAAHKLDE